VEGFKADNKLIQDGIRSMKAASFPFLELLRKKNHVSGGILSRKMESGKWNSNLQERFILNTTQVMLAARREHNVVPKAYPTNTHQDSV
jgi:hypothetical protein